MTTLSGSAIALQPRGEVRRLADDAALLRLSRPDQVTDDHDRPVAMPTLTRSGAPPRFRASARPRRLRARLAPRVRHRARAPADSRNRRAPLAHVLGDEASVARDHRRAASDDRPDDRTHVLGIEPSRHRGRTDEIAEHHGELTALRGVGRLRHRGGARCRGGLNRSRRDGRRALGPRSLQ